MPQYQEPVIKTCLRNTKNLCAQLQASAGVGACASDLPNNAIDDSDSFASVTNPSNIESCNGSFAIFNSAPIGASGNAVLIANMCIIPDGTSAP
ncbi:MAG: hypothetical protein Q8Q33_04995, partial [Chlamydiota bacterium]|nr:hypothetical protein [Chlamydiota bacterium]